MLKKNWLRDRVVNSKTTIRETVASADWATLVIMIRKLELRVSNTDPKSKKIKSKFGITKLMLISHFSQFNGHNEIDLGFYVGAVKTLKDIIGEIDKHKKGKSEETIFLSLIIEKLNTQKLTVKKTKERIEEFGKHKGVLKDDSSLQKSN